MSAVVVIPTRWGSTRFPGKAITDIAGKPMLVHVIDQVRKAQQIERIIVATDDERIAQVATAHQTDVVMTRSDHPSGTDRIAEALEDVQADHIINVQGDEPLINPALIDQLAEALHDARWDMVTAATPIHNQADVDDPSVVKTVFDQSQAALYFSRAPIPHQREAHETDSLEGIYWQHIGLYGYQRTFLDKLVKTPPCALEQLEKLEQLRALHLGGRIKIIPTDELSIGVDTPEDVVKAIHLLEQRREP